MNTSYATLDSLSRQQAIHARCVHPSGRFREFELQEIEQPIPSRFESIVRQYPERVPVKGSTAEFTYDALNKTANRVANAILQQRGEQEEQIGLLIEQGPQLIAAIFGVLKRARCTFRSILPSRKRGSPMCFRIPKLPSS